MTLDEVFKLINNLDMREPLRRYGPKWATVFVGRSGEILGVHRHKELLGKSDTRKDAALYPPGTVYFIAVPGAYTTHGQLARAVKDAVWVYEYEEKLQAK